mmetsp:Transcript_23985/g.23023  ORF Transcript_23985/g.23023 Transcript_23985/m.23023 type:complete len:612 (+) Transcript_23985:2409-4244(+)
MNEFSVKNYLYSKALSLEFPEYMYVSKNYYAKSWGLKTHRRLKNIIVVMDFAPSKSGLHAIADVGKGFSPMQEKNLRRAFQVADAEISGGIPVAELREVLKAVGVDIEGDGKDQFLGSTQLQGNGMITFEQLKAMLAKRMHYSVQAGRHYVALSLAEAECMRAALHCQTGVPLVPQRDTIVALRTEKTLLDMSTGYEPAQSHQDLTTQTCYKFFDSDTNYTQKDLTLLLRAMQNNTCDKRESFFAEVRSNRRRKQVDPASTSLSKVFVTADDHHMLNYRIATGRVTALLKSRGMYARDAFAAFDRNRDGMLDNEELRRGLEWLGLKMDQSLVSDIMIEVDKDKDGYINLEEFKAAVGWDEGSEGTENLGTFAAPSLPPPAGMEGTKVNVQIPQSVLNSIKVKVRKINKFQLVWTSKGSMSRQKGSLWEPIVGTGTFRANRAYVSLGHFVGSGYDSPNSDGKDRLTLEITDTQGSFVGGSSWLPHVLDLYLPRPARFRLVWSVTHGSNPFYAWEPIPPTDEFVAMGMIGTTKDTPPDVRVMRCVSKSWLKESDYVHSIWDDSGSGGREGSIWIFNTLNLAGFVAGHNPPSQRPPDLKNRRFFVRDYSKPKSL